jgi:hypothetical protein
MDEENTSLFSEAVKLEVKHLWNVRNKKTLSGGHFISFSCSSFCFKNLSPTLYGYGESDDQRDTAKLCTGSYLIL